jgi:ribosomal protein L37E
MAEDFFDKTFKNISKGMNTVQIKAKMALEKRGIKSQISELENQRNMLLQELGSIVYIMLKNKTLDESKLKSKFDMIQNTELQITKKQESLKDLEFEEQRLLYGKIVVGKCAKCGTLIFEEEKFCSSCGFPIKKADSSPNATPIIENQILCPNCGTRIDPEDKFCGKCGFKLK